MKNENKNKKSGGKIKKIETRKEKKIATRKIKRKKTFPNRKPIKILREREE